MKFFGKDSWETRDEILAWTLMVLIGVSVPLGWGLAFIAILNKLAEG